MKVFLLIRSASNPWKGSHSVCHKCKEFENGNRMFSDVEQSFICNAWKSLLNFLTVVPPKEVQYIRYNLKRIVSKPLSKLTSSSKNHILFDFLVAVEQLISCSNYVG